MPLWSCVNDQRWRLADDLLRQLHRLECVEHAGEAIALMEYGPADDLSSAAAKPGPTSSPGVKASRFAAGCAGP